MLRVKSVYSPIDRKRDGLRILATRGRGRGLRSTRYDVWVASLGPSEKILNAHNRGRISWAEFKRLYRHELRNGPLDHLNTNIKNHGQRFTLRLIKKLAQKGNVTLMCHCPEETAHCHRFTLRDLVLGA